MGIDDVQSSRNSGISVGIRDDKGIASVFSLSTIVFLAVSRLAVGMAGRSLLYLGLTLPLSSLVLPKTLISGWASDARVSRESFKFRSEYILPQNWDLH
jgi:hypothetical protein